MSWTSGTASDYIDLLLKLNDFLLNGHSLLPLYTGTGNGSIDGIIGTASSVQETITVSLTSASAFTVAGSVTGSMGSGTVGSAFSHAKVAFTVNAGSTAWVSGDTITFIMTPPWTALRAVASSEYIWKAPGNGGTSTIIVGAKAFYNASADYYNWWLQGAVAFDTLQTFEGQPGGIHTTDTATAGTAGPFLTLWNASTPYWFVADGQRVIVVAKISTYFVTAYLGLFETPFVSPGNWPYPMLVGGNMAWNTAVALTSTNLRWSYTGDMNRNWFCPYREQWAPSGTSGSYAGQSQLRLRDAAGSWAGFSYLAGAGGYAQCMVFPYAHGTDNMRPNIDGTYPRLPVILHDPSNVLGQFDGVCWAPGFNNAAENLLSDNRVSWLMVPNVYRNGSADFAAIRLS